MSLRDPITHGIRRFIVGTDSNGIDFKKVKDYGLSTSYYRHPNLGYSANSVYYLGYRPSTNNATASTVDSGCPYIACSSSGSWSTSKCSYYTISSTSCFACPTDNSSNQSGYTNTWISGRASWTFTTVSGTTTSDTFPYNYFSQTALNVSSTEAVNTLTEAYYLLWMHNMTVDSSGCMTRTGNNRPSITNYTNQFEHKRMLMEQTESITISSLTYKLYVLWVRAINNTTLSIQAPYSISVPLIAFKRVNTSAYARAFFASWNYEFYKGTDWVNAYA